MVFKGSKFLPLDVQLLVILLFNSTSQWCSQEVRADEIHTNQCIALIGQLKCLGKEKLWGMLAQHYCNLPTITTGTILFIADNPCQIPCFLACAERKKENFMNELTGIFLATCLFIEVFVGLWFYVFSESIIFSCLICVSQ